MRNTTKLFGIIAIVAVIGLFFASCGDNGGGGGGGYTPTAGLYRGALPNLVAEDRVALGLEDTNLVDAAFIYVNANPGTFTLLVGAPVTRTAAFSPAANVHLTIAGIGGRQTITRTANGNLINFMGGNRSVTLGDNITLVGHSGNNNALVNVASGGTFTMNAGAWITGNTTSAGTQSGGVLVNGAGSTFIMNGGEIFGNTAGAGAGTTGGGVRVADGATFVMHPGAVIRNNASEANSSAAGVFMTGAGSIFRMLGGEIRSNTAAGDLTGGGVRVNLGAFQIVNGVIFGGEEGANSNTGTNNALHRAGGTVTLGTMVDDVFTPGDSPVTLDSTVDTIRVVNGVMDRAFTVTFNTHNGTPVPTEQNVTQGGFATRPATAPTRDGFTFVDWFTTAGPADGALFAFATTPINANTVVHARWQADSGTPTFTVTFNTHNGAPVPAVQNVTQGGFATRPTANPTRTGFIFVDWFTTAETGGAVFAFATTPINANTVVHARWAEPQTFTVTFNADNGTPVPAAQNVTQGGFATVPPTAPTRGGFTPGAGLWPHPMPTATAYTFAGWFAPGQNTPFAFATTPINANITLTAQWTAPAMPIAGTVNNIASAITHVNANPGTFTLLVGAPVSHAAAAWTLAANVHLTVAGIGGRQTITRTGGTGNLFNVNGANRSLTLGDNITLVGSVANNTVLVNVAGGGSLTMNAGAEITGNRSTASTSAGAVVVTGGASTFTMNGGRIWGNTATGDATTGGGVRVADGASFVMQADAVIEGNTAEGTLSGGGVLVSDAASTFTMLGGEIRGNTATGLANTAGGVRAANGVSRIVTGVIYGGTGANANTGVTFNALLVNVGTVQRGTFVGDTWTPATPNLTNTNDTIRVVNGVLQ